MDPRESVQARKLRERFGEELRRWRTVRRWTMRDLAERMLFDPSYISHVERLRHRPTEDFARRADRALGAGGALLAIWQEYDAARGTGRAEPGTGARPGPTRAAAVPEPAGQALVVEREVAVQRFDGESYSVHISRDLHNQTTQPIIRYFIRVSVDEAPGVQLSMADLDLTAQCEGRPMDIDVETDHDTLKEMWLLFRNPSCRFPLQPGGRATIEYGYRVRKQIWGDWFQRSIRVPTRLLVVRLVFPAEHAPSEMWGLETSPPVADGTLDIHQIRTPTEKIYEWRTADPWMDARYRLEWRFPSSRSRPGSGGAARRSGKSGQHVDPHVDQALHC